MSNFFLFPCQPCAAKTNGKLVGIVLGSVLACVALVVIGVLYCLCERRKRAQQLRNDFPVPRTNRETADAVEDGIPEPSHGYNSNH